MQLGDLGCRGQNLHNEFFQLHPAASALDKHPRVGQGRYPSSSSCLCVPGKALKLKSVLEILLQISEKTHAASTRVTQLLGLRSGPIESHFATERTVPESEAKCMQRLEKGSPRFLVSLGPSVQLVLKELNPRWIFQMLEQVRGPYCLDQPELVNERRD